MSPPSVGGRQNGRIRFGVFEFDPRTRELTKHGTRLKVPEQPSQILAALIEQAGQIVSREELQRRLWPDGTFVDFDHSLNAAVNKLRDTLSDSADKPVYVETLARRGYRFVAPVERDAEPAPAVVPKRRPWLLVGAVVAGTVLLAVAVFWRLHEAAPPANLVAETLTSYQGTEYNPTFSPDGSKVAFAWNGEKQDNYDIYVKQIGTTGIPLRLTTHPLLDVLPAWSPDDRWIAFMRYEPDRVAIMLISPLGGPERKLADIDRRSGTSMSWTPDAKWLAYSAADPQTGFRNVWAISVETGERRRLTTFVTESANNGAEVLGDWFPSLSPDGRTLAFARQPKTYVFQLYSLRLTRDLRPDGEPAKIIGQNYSYVNGITWTANGTEIVYSAGGWQNSVLWRAPVSGRRAPTRLTYVFPDARNPAIAHTRPRLVYAWAVQNSTLWRLDTRTKERKMLAGSSYWDRDPQYSPDGSRIAFSSTRSGDVEIWTCGADGSNCQQLTSFGGPMVGSPRWSADGQWLALDSRADGQSEIYVIAADGGTPRRLTNHPADDMLPSWSRDGRWIYFASDRTGRFEVWKMPKDGGEAVQVTHSGGHAAFESADGKSLFYSKREGPGQPFGLFMMPVEGAQETKLPAKLWDWRFSVTSKGFYFTPEGKTGQFLNLASGKVSTLAVSDKVIHCLTASPDDAYVVWSQIDRTGMDLMLVEGFR